MVRTLDCPPSNKFTSPMASFNVKGSLLAGGLAAIGASVCCVGPLVLLMLGIGGAWVANLTAVEPLRPWFIGATVLFLGLAFRRLYLQPQVCEPGAVCAEPIVLRRQRRIFRIVALALLALLSVPWLAPFFL
jgi:mercuric ion transport protein